MKVNLFTSLGPTRARAKTIILVVLSVLVICPSLALAAGVHALFDLSTPEKGPFPSDRFTVADASHNTGLRVNLPKPDCQARPSDCEDLDVINTLDGFNLQPRLTVSFDGPIDVDTVRSDTVFLISLGSRLPGGDLGGRIIGINQVVWDPETNTLYVESDEFLDQHARYALIVTSGVHGQDGAPVEATEAFRRFRQEVGGDYKHALLDAVHAAHRAGFRESDIVTASVFTTRSATAVVEKIRDQIKAQTPSPASFVSNGVRTVFPLSTISSITLQQQTDVSPPGFTPDTVNLGFLEFVPRTVGTVAFGTFSSPNYQMPEKHIPPVGTLTGTPVIQGTNTLAFDLVLPSGAKPANGWPVAIFGHGGEGSKELLFRVASTMASKGFATIGINIPGHGFGPLSTIIVTQTDGTRVTFPAGGRGEDQNGDNKINANEGFDTVRPFLVIGNTDSLRQTVADLMQLVRVIRVGADVDGDGQADLDPLRIYYLDRKSVV